MKIIRRISVQILLVLLAISIFQAGSWWSRRGEVGIPATTTVPLVVYQTLVDRYQSETKGLRAALAARSEVQPKIILRVDTVPVPVPDTVIQFVNINSQGTGTLGRLTDVTPQKTATAEILKGLNLSNCDDGITITSSSIVCDKPRLGHLYLSGQVFGTSDSGFFGIAGLEWEPLYRSNWGIILGVSTEGLLTMGLHKRVELW